jgi:hypothetical protein
MPRVSKKAKALASLTAVVNNRMKARCLCMMDSDDEDSLEFLKDMASVVLESEIRKRRCYKRNNRYRKSRAAERLTNDFKIIDDARATSGSHASDSSSSLPWLSDEEFLQMFRVTKYGCQLCVL